MSRDEIFIRTRMLLGDEAMNILEGSRVAVFGIGGVGGYVAEALARSGVGQLDLIDNDTVDISNLNRQIIALRSNVGKYKTEIMKQRLLDINEDLKIETYNKFYLPGEEDSFPFEDYDYIVDAIDTVTAKLGLIMTADRLDIPIISSMGTGNKLNPSMLEVSDIYKTSVCPLAKVMRRELKKRGIRKLKCIYSKEEPIKPGFKPVKEEAEEVTAKRTRDIPGSSAFVPASAGLLIASEVVKDLIGR